MSETSDRHDDPTTCDWCGEPLSPTATVTPDCTAESYDFCPDCPAEEAWLLEDAITQDGIDKVEAHLSPANAAQYAEFPPALQIAFFYKCLRKGHITMEFPDRHHTALEQPDT